MPDRYELNEADMKQIEQAAQFTLMFEKQGLSQADLFLRDTMGITKLFHNLVVIYGREQANNLLEIVKSALWETSGFEELHDAYLLAVDVKRGLEERVSDED